MKDLFIGIFFVVFGSYFLILSLDYPIGKISLMGPGYFPLIISTLLILVGMLIIMISYKKWKS
jgi:hypothetical protein